MGTYEKAALLGLQLPVTDYSRKDLQTQLKQLRKEGYVREGFNLTSATWMLSDEYENAIAKKVDHYEHLVTITKECKDNYETRQQVATGEVLEADAEEVQESTTDYGLPVPIEVANPRPLHFPYEDYSIRQVDMSSPFETYLNVVYQDRSNVVTMKLPEYREWIGRPYRTFGTHYCFAQACSI